jgi:hypothetical protein
MNVSGTTLADYRAQVCSAVVETVALKNATPVEATLQALPPVPACAVVRDLIPEVLSPFVWLERDLPEACVTLLRRAAANVTSSRIGVDVAASHLFARLNIPFEYSEEAIEVPPIEPWLPFCEWARTAAALATPRVPLPRELSTDRTRVALERGITFFILAERYTDAALLLRWHGALFIEEAVFRTRAASHLLTVSRSSETHMHVRFAVEVLAT